MLSAWRYDHRMEPPIKPRHHEQARRAVVAAIILANDCGAPVQVSHPLERQPALCNIFGVLPAVERNSHIRKMLQRKSRQPSKQDAR
jgi:hypothetical protein